MGCPFFLFKRLPILLPIFVLFGCATQTLPPSFVSETPSMNFHNAPAVKMRVSSNVPLLRRPGVLYILPVKYRSPTGKQDKLSKDMESFIRDYLYWGLVGDAFHNMLLLKEGNIENYDDQETRIAVLETRIAHMTRGNGLLRYFIGFGLGQSDIQVEGVLRDYKTNEEILSFVMRYQHSGNAYQGMNPRALSGRYCLRMSIEQITITITDLIRDMWKNVEKTGMPEPMCLIVLER